MNYSLFPRILPWLSLLLPLQAAAQTTVNGSVTDRVTGEPLPRVTVWMPGPGATGTYTDNQGRFELTTGRSIPFELVFSAIGYAPDTVAVTGTSLTVALAPAQVFGTEIVVAASRLPENLLESPVSIEHLDLRAIRQSPAPNYYDAIGHVNGVDMVSSGLLFSTPTTRGFGASGNVGLIQLVDGMDNQAPGLNFAVGNVVGISELDIANIELLPGASSALYGAGGTNGTLLLNSKDPFQYQGLSAQVKGGIMHLGDPVKDHPTPFQQYTIRYDRAFHNRWAFKVNADYVRASDWIAADDRNYDKDRFMVKGGKRASDPGYDGVNVYGDETKAGMRDVAHGILDAATQQFVAGYQQQTGSPPSQAQIDAFLSTNPQTAPFFLGMNAGAIPDQVVSRTGYAEQDLVDYDTYNLKLGAMLAHKLTSGTTISLQAHYGLGTTVYTGTDRYSLRNFRIGQYKAELRSAHLLLRAYTTQENAGEAYNATLLGRLMNEGWKPSQVWYPEYVGAYLGALAGGAGSAEAHAAARQYADNGMPQPGSAAFNSLKDSVSGEPIPNGALFSDRSGLYHYEGLYSFGEQIPFAEVQAGANYRRYRLRSEGTIFDDKDQKLTIDQWGLFVQASRKLFAERLRLGGAIRYDKTDNFEGKWTPRITGVFTVAPRNHIRASYQSGYQLPTNQDQYIDLPTQQGTLIGGLPQFRSKYHLDSNPGFLVQDVIAWGQAYGHAYTSNLQAGNPDDVAQYKAAVAAEASLKDDKGAYKLYRFTPFKPETVHSFELGYRGLLGEKLMLDAYGYLSSYHDKIVSIFVVQPANGPQPIAPPAVDPNSYYGPQLAADDAHAYQTKVNSEGTIRTWGWALSLRYLLPANFQAEGNVSYNKMEDLPPDVFGQFNTPDYRVNIGLSNADVYKGLGFAVRYRFQDAMHYEGSFAIGDIPAVHTIDAQLSYAWKSPKITFKLGGTNVLNHYYRNAFGNPSIGGLYYLSVGYNVF